MVSRPGRKKQSSGVIKKEGLDFDFPKFQPGLLKGLDCGLRC